jgi:hypothetical protein
MFLTIDDSWLHKSTSRYLAWGGILRTLQAGFCLGFSDGVLGRRASFRSAALAKCHVEFYLGKDNDNL